MFEPLDAEARRGVAKKAIRVLGAEYGVIVEDLEPVLADAVLDMADASEIGGRALAYAARDLLADALADAVRDGIQGAVRLEAGPPPRVCAAA